MASGPITSWQIDGENVETVTDFIFLGLKITMDGDYSHGIKRLLLLERIAMTNLRQCIKKHTYHFAHKGLFSQSHGFSSSHGWMWELDHKEGWELKNWCFWTVVLDKSLESPLDCKEIKPVNPKGHQTWMVLGRTDVEAETLILWPPDVKNWLIERPWCWKRLRAGGEGDDRGWDGWMASLTQWMWVWANSGE